MIDCAGLVFSVGSARVRQQAEECTSTSADLNAAPGTMPNSSIAYLTGTMHNG